MNKAKNKLQGKIDWSKDGIDIQIDDQLYTINWINTKIEKFCTVINRQKKSNHKFFHLITQNNINTVIAFFAAKNCGLILVLHNPGITESELQECYQSTPPVAICRNINEFPESELESITEFPETLIMPENQKPPSDAMVILYTAAEDGYLKPALLSESNIHSNAQSCIERAKIEAESFIVTLAPLSSIFGFQSGIILPLLTKCSTLIIGKDKLLNPNHITHMFTKLQVTHVFTVPLIIYLLTKAPKLAESLRFNRFFLSGGAPLSKDLAQKFHSITGQYIHNGFGLTECSPYCFHNDPSVTGYIDAIGTPISCCEVKIVDENHQTLRANQIGEICIKGPHVFKGYYGFDRYSKSKIKDEWFYTGDLGWRNNEGIYFFHKLKKRMLNSGGKNVYPSEIERHLKKIPQINLVKVLGRPTALGNDLITAEIYTCEDPAIFKDQVKIWMKKNICNFKIPKVSITEV